MKRLLRIDDFGAGCFGLILLGVFIPTALFVIWSFV